MVDFEAINNGENYELLQLMHARHAFVFSSTLLIISPFFVGVCSVYTKLLLNKITKKNNIRQNKLSQRINETLQVVGVMSATYQSTEGKYDFIIVLYYKMMSF